MLKVTKNITLNGQSMTPDGKSQIAGFSATIDSNNPEDMTFGNWQSNKALYKEYRSTVAADRAEFEDMAYAIQDELLNA